MKTYQAALRLFSPSTRPQWNPDYNGPNSGEFYCAEDFNSVIAERNALKAELDSMRNQEPVAYRSIVQTPGRPGKTRSNYCTTPWPQGQIVHPLFASPAPAQQQEPIAYLSWEKSGDLDCTKYKPIRAGTEIFTHRVNSDSWEVLPVYASNITAQQLTYADMQTLRIKADAHAAACMACAYSGGGNLEAEIDSLHRRYVHATEQIMDMVELEITSALNINTEDFWDLLIKKYQKIQSPK